MTPKVLFVDDDPNILDAFQRHLRKAFALETAGGGEEGLEAVQARGPFAVIVSDLRMPKMDGIQFLSRVRETAPDSVRMMLTGNADLQTAIDAVNEGNIFRFLTKPCDSQLLVKAVVDGVRQYQLVVSERELLQKTLRGSLKVLSEILQLINPEAFGRASRITHYAKEIGKIMRVSDQWQLETAAALSQIGCVILPETALQKLYQGRNLTGEEKQLFEMHPFIASDLLTHIPRMQGVAEIITYQEKYFDGSGIPQDARRGKEIPLAGRILKVILDFDTQQAGGASKTEAVERMSATEGRYDPEVLSALEAIIGYESGHLERNVDVEGLEDGMILAEDVRILDGRLLVARGYQVNRTLRERLKNFSRKPGIKEPIRVLVPLPRHDAR
ncbi:MAG: HD domain-containing phosphohydrolase [Syntrophobacteraceae bacterium]